MPFAEQLARGAPELIVLDVNETLSDLTGLESAFVEVGLQPTEVEAWFAAVLRDAFAMTVLGDNPAFAEIGRALLEQRLQAAGLDDRADEAVHQVMDRFASLAPHPDVVTGLAALADLGCRIITLSNGSADVARALLADTPAGGVIEHYLSVADAQAWKPAAAAYQHALRWTSVSAGSAMLVAVHPWDIAGAARAGLRTAWLRRRSTSYPAHFPAAELEVSTLEELAAVLSGQRE